MSNWIVLVSMAVNRVDRLVAFLRVSTIVTEINSITSPNSSENITIIVRIIFLIIGGIWCEGSLVRLIIRAAIHLGGRC